MMRQPGLAKGSPAHTPAARSTRKAQLHGAHRFFFQAATEAQLRSRETQESLDGAREQPLACAVDQAKFRLVIKRKNGDVDFFHDRAQKRSGLQRAEALLAKRLAERVDLDH